MSKRIIPAESANARERVRLALRARLSEIRMTGREFGRRFSANDGKGHVDTWVSGLLKGQFALSLEELDEAARIVKMTPAELVKGPWETAEYLTPTEHRIMQALRGLPPSIRDHFLTLAEYLIGVAPEEIDFLLEFRGLATDEERAKVKHWTRALRMSREPVPGLAILPDHSETSERPDPATPRSRGRSRK